MSILSVPPLRLNIAAGIIIIALGLFCIIRSGPMVKDFKIIITGMRRVLFMALVWQGLTLCFIGAVVVTLAAAGQRDAGSRLVSSLCAGMLLILGIWTGSTGGRSEYVLFRIGQFALVIAAMMLFVGNLPR
jgi:hypothetical protein